MTENVLYSLESKAKSGATQKGMAVKEVEFVAKNFLEKIPGAAGVTLHVSRSQPKVIKNPKIRTNTEADTHYLVAPYLTSSTDVRRALQHETLVHKGEQMMSPSKSSGAQDIYRAIQISETVEAPSLEATTPELMNSISSLERLTWEVRSKRRLEKRSSSTKVWGTLGRKIGRFFTRK